MRGYFGSKICGFRPTGRLHLGHYFSVIKPGLEGATVLVANYHAPDEKDSEKSIEILKRFGVKNIIQQKDVFDAAFFFKLLTLVSVPELKKMPQFNASVLSLKSQNQTAQLLTYPVLMAHDIEGYKEVYVGNDQIAHIEIARKLLKRYSVEAICPEPIITTKQINDLRYPLRKMSKSFENGCLFLDDSKDDIRRKITKAVTDESGIENLRILFEEFVGKDMPTSNAKAKEELGERIIDTIVLPLL